MSELVISGRPITKKNSQVIRKGRIVQKGAYYKYRRAFIKGASKYHGKRYREGEWINVEAKYWLPGESGWPDLIGLLQATSDLLKEAKIIYDDKFIRGYDGSCIAGISEDNPRVHIKITRSKV